MPADDAGTQSATESQSPAEVAPERIDPAEYQRVLRKLELVTEDKRRAGETNATLNERLQELERQLQSRDQQQLLEQGEYKKLWEDAKVTITGLNQQLADLQHQLDTERQAHAAENLRSRALHEITAAKALRPDQLLALLATDLREVDGKPAILSGGIEVPLADHLTKLRSPDSGWEHHFAPTAGRGMGALPATPTTAPPTNPFLATPPNLSEIARLYMDDRALHDRLKAEATRA